MDFHLVELFASQLSGLRDDVLRNAELADVVKQSGGSQRLDFGGRQAKALAYFKGIDLDALEVIVRGMILRLDSERERFNRAQVQRCHFLGVFLFVLHPGQIQPIGPVDQIDHRHDQQRRLPSDVAVDRADCTCDGRPDQVVRERPEVAFVPDFAERAPFR